MHSFGTLPAFPGAGSGVWHREINVMFSNEAYDLQLPDFYFNLLVPLDPVTADNGTEMVVGARQRRHYIWQISVVSFPINEITGVSYTFACCPGGFRFSPTHR